MATLALACGRKSPGTSREDAGAAVRTANEMAEAHTMVDLTRAPHVCTFWHQGLLLDFGEPSASWRLVDQSSENIEYEGATWMRVRSKPAAIPFVVSADLPDAPTVITARLRGTSAKGVHVQLNGTFVGVLSARAPVARIRAPRALLNQGANELVLRVPAPNRVVGESSIDIDWLLIGTEDVDASYPAPTYREAMTTTTVGVSSRRGALLRPGASLRCTLWSPAGARLESGVSLLGAGDATLDVSIARDRVPATSLGTSHLTQAQATATVRAPIDKEGPIEIVWTATSSQKGARVLVTEPKLVMQSTPPSPSRPSGSGVLLVVSSLMHARALSLYSGTESLPGLEALARSGHVYRDHRASSPLAAAAFASMLTGLEVPFHGLADPYSRLSSTVTTIGDAARQAGVTTALFTANPTTGDAFGFARGWTTFVPFAADVPHEQAALAVVEWIRARKGERFLAVVHTRGAHPPWNVSSEQLRQVEPAGYAGVVDPKTAGELFARARRGAGGARLTDSDRARAWALYRQACLAEDAALAKLIAGLESSGALQQTTVIVTSDAGPDESLQVPLGDGENLDETSLAVPLVIKPAQASGPPSFAERPTSSVDIAATALDALGLTPPRAFVGQSLLKESARDGLPVRLAATSSRTALRVGTFLLQTHQGREQKLCDLALEPLCTEDVKSTHPRALTVLRRAWFDRTQAPPMRERAEPDASTLTRLRLWGR